MNREERERDGARSPYHRRSLAPMPKCITPSTKRFIVAKNKKKLAGEHEHRGSIAAHLASVEEKLASNLFAHARELGDYDYRV